MERKITLARRGLLVLCLGMVAGSMAFHRRPSPFLSGGDPTQLTQRSLQAGAPQGVPVQITTPTGTSWKYVDFSEGMSLAEFLNNMGEELFGKAAYAQSAGQDPGFGIQDSGRARGEIPPPRSVQDRDERRSSTPRLLDSLTPRVPNTVHIVARHRDGTIFYDQTFHNLRTNAGINWQYGQMAGTTAAVCTYIALSNDSGTPNATDTAVASEITANGLSRANGTASHTSNATSYTIAYTFTATGAQSAQKAGLLNASSSGTLCFENTFSQVALQSGDTLQVQWTINF